MNNASFQRVSGIGRCSWRASGGPLALWCDPGWPVSACTGQDSGRTHMMYWRHRFCVTSSGGLGWDGSGRPMTCFHHPHPPPMFQPSSHMVTITLSQGAFVCRIVTDNCRQTSPMHTDLAALRPCPCHPTQLMTREFICYTAGLKKTLPSGGWSDTIASGLCSGSRCTAPTHKARAGTHCQRTHWPRRKYPRGSNIKQGGFKSYGDLAPVTCVWVCGCVWGA